MSRGFPKNAEIGSEGRERDAIAKSARNADEPPRAKRVVTVESAEKNEPQVREELKPRMNANIGFDRRDAYSRPIQFKMAI